MSPPASAPPPRSAAQIRRVDPEAEAQILIYWLDHLGTPQELSNENGELVWQVALKAWGGVGRTFVERVPQNLRFQGQYYDDETGLHYNRFRHYDPAAGCSLNPDPIGLEGGARLFSYPGNPLTEIDPLGLMCGTVNSKSAKIKQAQLPNKGKIRYIPSKTWKGTEPLPRGPNKGFIDRFENEWVKGPSRTKGQDFEWDVQLSNRGRESIGWATRDGSHANVSSNGKITHK